MGLKTAGRFVKDIFKSGKKRKSQKSTLASNKVARQAARKAQGWGPGTSFGHRYLASLYRFDHKPLHKKGGIMLAGFAAVDEAFSAAMNGYYAYDEASQEKRALREEEARRAEVKKRGQARKQRVQSRRQAAAGQGARGLIQTKRHQRVMQARKRRAKKHSTGGTGRG